MERETQVISMSGNSAVLFYSFITFISYDKLNISKILTDLQGLPVSTNVQ